MNRLTDRAIKAHVAKRRAGAGEPKRLPDGGGLYLTVTDSGAALWRVKYRFAGKEKLAALGQYPDVTLEKARAARAALREQLREGLNPSAEKRKAKLASAFAADKTFAVVAGAWLDRQKPSWSKIHYAKSKRALERDVLPTLGRLPVGEITSGMVAAVVQGIAARGVTETAGRVLEHIGNVFEYAQALDLRKDNPAAPVRQLLPKRKAVVRRPALLEIGALREVLRLADAAPISPSVRLAHRLCAFTAQRIGNVTLARWEEFDLDAAAPVWTIPRAKMKKRDRDFEHTVLLSRTIAAELRTWRKVTGGSGYVFPSPAGDGPVTREAVEKVLKVTLGLRGKHSCHGWRASFSTLARDSGFTRDVVAIVLDHEKDSATRRAYDRGERLEERKKLTAWWDEQLTDTA